MSMPASQKSPPRDFNSVETWVFDLDNTLYPHDLNLWQQIDDRIRSFVSDFLKVTKDEAFRVQKDYYKRYGTTSTVVMPSAWGTLRFLARSSNIAAFFASTPCLARNRS